MTAELYFPSHDKNDVNFSTLFSVKFKFETLGGIHMANTTAKRATDQEVPTQLTLKIWHPHCWTLETTAEIDAGLISHGVYIYDDVVSARMTAYADTNVQIERLVEAISDSDLTYEVNEITDYFNPRVRSQSAGNATQELLIKYEPKNSIYDAFISRGFIPDEEVRMYDGYEYWTVIVSQPRSVIPSRLDEIRDEMNAEITVESMTSTGTTSTGEAKTAHLSERQREVMELAKRMGYYTWPRETSASDLADELGISKTTLLEHLRKAESKIIGTGK